MQVAVEKGSGRICKCWFNPTTVTEFEKWEEKQAGDGNYEFYFKKVRKTSKQQLKMGLTSILLRCFWQFTSQEKGVLYQKTFISIGNGHKYVADLAYFSNEQISSIVTGKKQIPLFVAEILSGDEFVENTEEKLKGYFDAGVRVVRYISSTSKSIYVYTSNTHMKIFAAGDVASAAPVLPDFNVNIDKLFTTA